MRRPLAFTFVLLPAAVAALCPTLATSSSPTSISGSAIGPVRLGARPEAVRAWLGKPDRIWRESSGGYGSGPVIFHGELWGYSCGTFLIGSARLPCWTLFGFLDGTLASASSNSRAFATAHGTRVGSALTDVLAHESHKPFGGWQVQCPGVQMNVGGGTLTAHLDFRAHTVYGFYLTQPRRDSFSSCGS